VTGHVNETRNKLKFRYRGILGENQNEIKGAIKQRHT
jgi:hypothetical protein